MGVSPTSGSNGIGPIKANQSSNPRLEKLLSNDMFTRVLKELDINPQTISNLSEKPGLPNQIGLPEATMVPMNTDLANVLSTLGISNAHMALVISQLGTDQIKTIKTRLKEIEDSIEEEDKEISEELTDVLKALGFPIAKRTMVFNNKNGGILIVRSALEEIEESID
ncbi:MAG: hypothetical protein CL521_05490 [Actinobacteria bacterium]|nr:hypothetical protein [Actinomycetota bacterium]|tara:strand:- start:40 stop:540 length:501 start_codon:yes stop_codon:yes gene_type:complete